MLIVTISIVSAAFALNEWYEGYKLEPYYWKSYDPLIKQYSNGLILDLVKNRVVARGEYPITGLITYNNRVYIENKATDRAIRELIDAVGELRVSTNERVYNLTRNSTIVAEAIEKRIKATVNILHYRIFTMKRVLRVTSAAQFKGPNSVLNAIYPYLIEREGLSASEEEENSGEDEPEDIVDLGEGVMPYAPEMEASTIEADSPTFNVAIKGSYSGLIIDARNLKVEPAIDPVIIDNADDEVFGKISNFDINLLYKRGKTGYTKTLDAARANYRAGKNPLVIKATGARRNCDPIVSQKDAFRIIEENKITGFLEKLYVTIVI